ncbi:MAG: hypothetical protein WB798_04460 [Nocardioidaceae bacterium]
MQDRTKYAGATLVSAVVLGSVALTATGSAASARHDDDRHDGHRHGHGHTVSGRLNTLNNSGVSGHGRVTVEGKRLKVRYDATKLAAGLPHAAHIHYGEQARHECPTVADDTNGDFRLNVAEGLPAYGDIAASLTTSGDTTKKSALAVDRFPTAPKGKVHYRRVITTTKDVARAVRKGEGVLVVHGVDYNDNGKYDFDGAGKSELNAEVPAEATDPAVCGVLR